MVEMKRFCISGDVFSYSSPFHDRLLQYNYLLLADFGNNPIVVAAPHHIPLGKDPVPKGMPSDENAGYLARNIAYHLRCKMVVAANASHDPNKIKGTYTRAIIADKPDVLVETHVHDKNMTCNDIEVSCGTNEMAALSARLSSVLEERLNVLAADLEHQIPEIAEQLRNLRVSGDFDSIYYKATRTRSLKAARRKDVLTYHIEFDRAIVSGRRDDLPRFGSYVSLAVARSIADAHKLFVQQECPFLEARL